MCGSVAHITLTHSDALPTSQLMCNWSSDHTETFPLLDADRVARQHWHDIGWGGDLGEGARLSFVVVAVLSG